MTSININLKYTWDFKLYKKYLNEKRGDLDNSLVNFLLLSTGKKTYI